MSEQIVVDKVEKKSVSLRADQVEWINRIALAEKHKNFSRVVQDAVDREINRRERDSKDPVAA